MSIPIDRCFACDRKLGPGSRRMLVDTRDDQRVFVGPECFKLIDRAGEDGYQPPKGGPRLFPLSAKASNHEAVICPDCGSDAMKDENSVCCFACEKLWPLAAYQAAILAAVRDRIEVAAIEHCNGSDLWLATNLAARHVLSLVVKCAPAFKESTP